jgi:hypothetical protein
MRYVYVVVNDIWGSSEHSASISSNGLLGDYYPFQGFKSVVNTGKHFCLL